MFVSAKLSIARPRVVRLVINRERKASGLILVPGLLGQLRPQVKAIFFSLGRPSQRPRI